MKIDLAIAGYRGTGLDSRVIEVRSLSPYSHVSFVLLDRNGNPDMEWEAWSENANKKNSLFFWRNGSVQFVKFGRNHAKGTRVDLIIFPDYATLDVDKLLAFCNEHSGEPYDWEGVFMVPFQHKETDKEFWRKWFCSKFVFMGCRAGELACSGMRVNLVNGKRPEKVTPGDIMHNAIMLPYKTIRRS